MTERRRLVREEGPALQRAGRGAQRDEGERAPRTGDSLAPGHGGHAGRRARLAEDEDRGRDSAFPLPLPGGRRRWTQGRPTLAQDFGDVGRGGVFMGIESAAIVFDTAARVLRAAVDRAFDEDYERPGDLVRGVASEADLAAYDLANELRTVPRRLSRRFDESLQSPRADRGERERREDQDVDRPRPRRRDP